MRPSGRIRPHRPVADLNNTTINECTRGWGLERPGDGVAALFLEGDFGWSESGRDFLDSCFFCIIEYFAKPLLMLLIGFLPYTCTVGLHTGYGSITCSYCRGLGTLF